MQFLHLADGDNDNGTLLAPVGSNRPHSENDFDCGKFL